MEKALFSGAGFGKKLTNKNGLWQKLIFRKLKKEFDVAVAFRQCAPNYIYVLDKVKAKVKVGFVHGDVQYMEDISTWQPLMRRFDKIAYVSNSAKQNFISRYPELSGNAMTVYNMFDFAAIGEKSMLPNGVELSTQAKTIVTVARIDNASKQMDWIPQICAKLKQQTDVPFHWYILGSGGDRESVENLSEELGTQDVLSFTGMIPNPYGAMKNAYLGVLTSKTEGYCMTVIETLCLGTPMVLTNFQSASEQLTHGVDGLIAPMNVDGVVAAVKAMLENQDGIYDRCIGNLANRVFTNDLPYTQFMDGIA